MNSLVAAIVFKAKETNVAETSLGLFCPNPLNPVWDEKVTAEKKVH